jgi:hypothetical protein
VEAGSIPTASATTHSGGCLRQQKGTHDDGRRTLRRSRASQLQRRPPTACNPSRAPRRLRIYCSLGAKRLTPGTLWSTRALRLRVGRPGG